MQSKSRKNVTAHTYLILLLLRRQLRRGRQLVPTLLYILIVMNEFLEVQTFIPSITFSYPTHLELVCFISLTTAPVPILSPMLFTFQPSPAKHFQYFPAEWSIWLLRQVGLVLVQLLRAVAAGRGVLLLADRHIWTQRVHQVAGNQVSSYLPTLPNQYYTVHR